MPRKQKSGVTFAEDVKKVVWNDRSIAAKFYPYLKDEPSWILPKSQSSFEIDEKDGLPIPPQELWVGYWKDSAEYIASGRSHFERMMNILRTSGLPLKERLRILDFGCGAGRVIRNFKELLGEREVWGVDISAKHILWCSKHLSPPLKFSTVTTYPHLPFEDNYFDIIYAGAVFSHISDLAEAWLLELRRILHPEGRLYITVYDNHSVKIILSSPPDSWLHGTTLYERLLEFEKEKHFSETGFSMVVISGDPGNSLVFYDIDYLRCTWGMALKILSVDHEAFGYQTAITMSKTTYEKT